MKWTTEKCNELIALRNNKLSYEDIAQIMGCSILAAKARGSILIREGKLARTRDINKFEREELIKVVQQYISRDNCPMEYRHYIIKEFGSWSEAMVAANVTGKCGGTFSNVPTTLYLLKFDGFYKIGVTQRQIEQRFAGAPSYTVLDQYCSDLDEIIALEKEILSKLERTLPSDPWFERNGKTECFLFPFDPTLADLI